MVSCSVGCTGSSGAWSLGYKLDLCCLVFRQPSPTSGTWSGSEYAVVARCHWFEFGRRGGLNPGDPSLHSPSGGAEGSQGSDKNRTICSRHFHASAWDYSFLFSL